MTNLLNEITPHPCLVDLLFAYKSSISPIFKDVLGIHDISHIAVTRITEKQEILIFSSTPAMEFNLFTSNLWKFDNTYNPTWFRLCTQSSWENLYHPAHYDELYYSKQIKHHFSTGLSLSVVEDNVHYIYSIASSQPASSGQEIFINKRDDFYKIGQYCKNLLTPYFIKADIPQKTTME